MKNINPLYENIGIELNLGELVSFEIVQSLWSGYGEIVRLNFLKNSIIVKHIKLPKSNEHPHGWNTNLSHQRKIHSYKVEVYWYQNFSSNIDEYCRIPQGLKYFQSEDEWLIVMEDLVNTGFNKIITKANKNHLKASIKWLANFHGRYMGVKSDFIWLIGTYWHLDTRPDELEGLEDKKLKLYAKKVDIILKSTKYQTIVHGDAKLANFCFDNMEKSCAAVDFQYVGHGCGMKDIIYFMSSAVKPEDCSSLEKWILDTYFFELDKALKHYNSKIKASEVEKEWRILFSVSWADFQRFVKGWNASHYKINPYTEKLTAKALNYLKTFAI